MITLCQTKVNVYVYVRVYVCVCCKLRALIREVAYQACKKFYVVFIGIPLWYIQQNKIIIFRFLNKIIPMFVFLLFFFSFYSTFFLSDFKTSVRSEETEMKFPIINGNERIFFLFLLYTSMYVYIYTYVYKYICI